MASKGSQLDPTFSPICWDGNILGNGKVVHEVIATSHNLAPNGGLIREILNSEKSGLVKYYHFLCSCFFERAKNRWILPFHPNAEFEEMIVPSSKVTESLYTTHVQQFDEGSIGLAVIYLQMACGPGQLPNSFHGEEGGLDSKKLYP